MNAAMNACEYFGVGKCIIQNGRCSVRINANLFIWVVATQIFLEFSSRSLGKIPIQFDWRIFFSNGLVQPPTSYGCVQIIFCLLYR